MSRKINIRAIIKVIAWLLLYSSLYLVFSITLENKIALLISTITEVWIILFTYFNQRVLLKHFIKKRKFVLYGVSLITLLIISNLFFRNILLTPEFNYPFYNVDFFRGNKTIASTKAVHMVYIQLVLFQALFVSSIVDFTNSIYLEKDKLSKFRIEMKNTELKLMKAQFTPHFLLNALNNLYSILKIRPKQSEEHLVKLISLMKYVTYDRSNDEVSIEQEIHFINDYIFFQKAKDPDNYVVNFRVSSNAEIGFITPRILITFIENAFKHSYNPAIPCEIDILIEKLNQDFVFKVRNNISSITRNKSEEGYFGIGIETVKEILRLKYEDRHQLSIIENKDEYEIELLIQNVYHEKD